MGKLVTIQKGQKGQKGQKPLCVKLPTPPNTSQFGQALSSESAQLEFVALDRWVRAEDAKAHRVLPQMAQLLGMTVDQLYTIKDAVYATHGENYTACAGTCMVYAGGLMLRWVRMAPIDALGVWTPEDEGVPSAELLAGRWQKLHSLGPHKIALIFTVSLCVATKQLNSPNFEFGPDIMPGMRRLGCLFSRKRVRKMEVRFLRHLRWCTHLRIRPDPASPEAQMHTAGETYEYNNLVEALPTLVKDGIVEWEQLYAVTAESGELADHRALSHAFGSQHGAGGSEW